MFLPKTVWEAEGFGQVKITLLYQPETRDWQLHIFGTDGASTLPIFGDLESAKITVLLEVQKTYPQVTQLHWD